MHLKRRRMNIKQYDTSISFWELYPDLKKHKEFKALYKKDKQSGKLSSSRMMWAFAYYVDISMSNQLRNLPDSEKEEIINDDYLAQGVYLEPLKNAEAITAMSKLLMPRKRGVLKNYYSKLEERASLLEKTAYTLENAKELDNLIANTDKLFDAISKIESSLEHTETDGRVAGGRIESASEKGLI